MQFCLCKFKETNKHSTSLNAFAAGQRRKVSQIVARVPICNDCVFLSSSVDLCLGSVAPFLSELYLRSLEIIKIRFVNLMVVL